MTIGIGDRPSVLFEGLSGFWQAFFKDSPDLVAYYQAAEVYLGQVYLDLMEAVLGIGAIDTPVFSREEWKLFAIRETELNFQAGQTANEDRYVYDMPGDVVFTDFMQNVIFNPSVIFERGVDFDVLDSDGLARFYDDIFREYTSDSGELVPTPGVAWRTIAVEVGNNFSDTGLELYGAPAGFTAYDEGIRRGDTLRLLASRGVEVTTNTDGAITKVVDSYLFAGTSVGSANVGDVIQVYDHDGGVGHADDAYKGFYVVKQVYINPPDPNQVELEPLSVRNSAPAGSTANLYWRLRRAVYFEDFRDYEVDYIDGARMVGAPDNAYPLDLEGSLVYSIVRTPAEPEVYGVPLTFMTASPPYPAMDLPYPPPYTPKNPPPQYVMDLGSRHVDPGSLVIFAVKTDGSGNRVEEGVDYTVDYLRGIVYQLTYWKTNSNDRCQFTHKTEVLLSGAGDALEQTVGNVRQISTWVPSVQIDRFTLFYNYGSMLNRFEASSEMYKSFLLGIMYLYVTGPILQRIEAALNVAAGYPVTRDAGEVLIEYDNGQNGAGVAASIDGLNDTVTIPIGEYVLSEPDVGGFIVFPDPLNDANSGKFRVLEVYTDTNSALLETTYGMVTETPVNWELTRTYARLVITSRTAYEFPYYVPIREDIQDVDNWGVLTFVAFEPLTEAFTVTDYLEDPDWWHNKTIPEALWPTASSARRRATTGLYAHVVGAEDQVCIGDPGFFIGADNSGNVFTPNDNTSGPGVGGAVSIYRNNTAFVLFDQYLKANMFYIEFSADLELDAQFRDDLQDLVLVAKPSGTYPTVEQNDTYIDNVALTDDFEIPAIGFGFDEDDRPDTIRISQNELNVGDEDFPWYIGDFFFYENVSGNLTGVHPDPIPPGYTFDVGFHINTGQRLLNISMGLNRTSDGELALEGRDYTVDWHVERPTGVANPDAWQVTTLTECTGGGPVVTFVANVATRVLGAYDTTLGHTPLLIGGPNPWYIRKHALDPTVPSYATEWAKVRTEHVDRALELTIVDSGGSYTYP